jgi:hypothetical protein
MFTARTFVANWEREDWDKLVPSIEAEPERLVREFFAIVADRNENYSSRSLALKILRVARKSLKIDCCPEIAEELVRLVNEEFPPEELRAIQEFGQAGGLGGKDFFILQLGTCFPVLVPNGGVRFTKMVRETLRGTLLDGCITGYLKGYEGQAGSDSGENPS